MHVVKFASHRHQDIYNQSRWFESRRPSMRWFQRGEHCIEGETGADDWRFNNLTVSHIHSQVNSCSSVNGVFGYWLSVNIRWLKTQIDWMLSISTSRFLVRYLSDTCWFKLKSLYINFTVNSEYEFRQVCRTVSRQYAAKNWVPRDCQTLFTLGTPE